MSLINFNDSDPKSSGEKKSLSILIGIGALVGLVVLGSTLAASINLNSGSPVEFGQGVAQTTACDSQILITPYSEFVNGEPGAFMFSGLTLSQVDTTDQSNETEGCSGKSFSIKLYKQNGDLINSNYTINVGSDGVFSSDSGNVNASNEGSTDGSVNLSFTSPSVFASDVYTITVESSTTTAPTESAYITTCNTGAEFNIGDITRGGYVFLTPNCSDNPTGKYFVALTGSAWRSFTDNYLEGNDFNTPWCDDATSHGINGTGIGDGETNSDSWFIIMNTCNSTQLHMVDAYNQITANQSNGYRWFIPSKLEMFDLAKNLFLVNQSEWNLDENWYWTSSEIDHYNMWMLNVDNWTNVTDNKLHSSRVIPVLSFTSGG